MDATSGPPPFNFFGERLAEIIKKTIKQQMAQSDQKDTLGPKLEQMIEQQQQTNAQLGHLVTAVSQLSERVQENTERMNQNAARRNAAPPFWKKMALEVPPVVLAVLLAFGINSWWQQRQRAQVAAEARANIIDEVQRNLSLLEPTYEENQRRIVTMKELVQQARAYPDTLLQSIGVSVAPATDAAWQTAHLTGAVQNLDRTFIQNAADLYGLQKEVREVLYASVAAQNSIDSYRPENLIPSLMADASVIENYADGSQFVIRRYRQFLEKYSSKTNDTVNLPQ